jgi:hypothetical protein
MAAGWKDALMADTGAPWNIPYVEPGDLVRDYPAASLALGTAIAAGLSAAVNPGIGSNVVQTVKTDTFTTTSTSYTTVTGLTATITPSSATSKIVVIAQVTHGLAGSATGYGHFRIAGGNTSGYIGDAASNRVRNVFGGSVDVNLQASMPTGVMVFVDSPSSASPVTYSVEARQASAGTVFVNRSFGDADNAFNGRGASSITVIEVKV